MAPTHVLVVPRATSPRSTRSSELPGEAQRGHAALRGRGGPAAGVDGSGYRVVTNTGPDSGQEVMHLHWHVLGGRRLGGDGMIREAGALEERIKADTVIALKAGD